MSSGIDYELLGPAMLAGPVCEVIPLPEAIGGGICLFTLGLLAGWLLNDSVRKYRAWQAAR